MLASQFAQRSWNLPIVVLLKPFIHQSKRNMGQVFDPLKIAYNHPTSVGIQIWQHNNFAIIEDFVSPKCYWSIGSFNNQLGLNFRCIRVGDCAFQSRRNQNVTGVTQGICAFGVKWPPPNPLMLPCSQNMDNPLSMWDQLRALMRLGIETNLPGRFEYSEPGWALVYTDWAFEGDRPGVAKMVLTGATGSTPYATTASGKICGLQDFAFWRQIVSELGIGIDLIVVFAVGKRHDTRTRYKVICAMFQRVKSDSLLISKLADIEAKIMNSNGTKTLTIERLAVADISAVMVRVSLTNVASYLSCARQGPLTLKIGLSAGVIVNKRQPACRSGLNWLFSNSICKIGVN